MDKRPGNRNRQYPQRRKDLGMQQGQSTTRRRRASGSCESSKSTMFPSTWLSDSSLGVTTGKTMNLFGGENSRVQAGQHGASAFRSNIKRQVRSGVSGIRH